MERKKTPNLSVASCAWRGEGLLKGETRQWWGGTAQVVTSAQPGPAQNKAKRISMMSKYKQRGEAWRSLWHTAPGGGHRCRKQFSPTAPPYFKSF